VIFLIDENCDFRGVMIKDSDLGFCSNYWVILICEFSSGDQMEMVVVFNLIVKRLLVS